MATVGVVTAIIDNDDEEAEEEEDRPPGVKAIMATGVSGAERRVGILSLRVDIDRLGDRERGGLVNC